MTCNTIFHSSRTGLNGCRGAVAAVVALLLTASSVGASTAEVRLVVQLAPSGSDVTTSLPQSQSILGLDTTFYVEIWAQTTHGNGLSSVSLDLAYDADLATAVAVSHSALFSSLTNSMIDNGSGLVDDLSGSHLGPCSDAVAVAPDWARVAIVEMSVLAPGTLPLQSGPTGTPAFGTAICGIGDIDPAQVVYGQQTIMLDEMAIPALSEWGLAVLTLCLLVSGSLFILSRRTELAA